MSSRGPRNPRPSAYQAAIARLARRDHSEAQMRQALLGAGYSADEIDDALHRLKGLRAVDDRGLAERFSRSRLAHSGLGQHRIRAALARRGVPGAALDEGLSAALQEVSEAAVLDERARRYWRARTKDAPEARLRKLFGFLVARGFPGTLVGERLRALWPRWSDALHGLEEAADDAWGHANETEGGPLGGHGDREDR